MSPDGIETSREAKGVKIIHTSDWHLGARLHDEDRAVEHAAFLDWLVGVLKAERPDVLLVAGDVFDSAAPSASSMKAYHEFVMRAVGEAGCRNVVVIGGNHDSPSWLGMSRAVLQCVGVTVIPAGEDEIERECVLVRHGGRVVLAIAAVPYLREAELANLVRTEGDARTHDELVRAGYAEHCRRAVESARAMAGSAPVVLTGHCVLSGCRLSDDISERQRGVPRVAAVGGVKSVDVDALPKVDYLALGHLHVPQKVAGRDAARYSGSPIPMSFAEAGVPKQILSVTLGEKSGDAVAVKEMPVPSFLALERVEGSPDAIEARLAELARGGGRIYAEVCVTRGEGDVSQRWAKFAAVASANPGMKILVERDLREMPAAGSGLAGIAEGNEVLSTLDEMSVARARLGEENLTDDDRGALEDMLREVISEVKSGADEDGREGADAAAGD